MGFARLPFLSVAISLFSELPWKSKISWNKRTILERDNAQRIAQFRSQETKYEGLRALRFYVKRFEGMYIVTNFLILIL